MQKVSIVKFIKINSLICIILIISASLRFVGSNPGYNKYHSDEPILYGTAIDMVLNGNINPTRFDYPAGSIFINYLAFKYFFIPSGWAVYYVRHVPDIIEGTVHIPISPVAYQSLLRTDIIGNSVYYPLFWGRYVVALFSLGNVLMVYLLTKKLFGKKTALIAALLVCVDFRQVFSARVDLPDVYNAFFLLLSIFTAVNVLKEPTNKRYLIAGVAAGVSFSMKYQFFGFIPLGVVHLLIAISNKSSFYKKLVNVKVILSAIGAILLFLLLNPYFFVHLESARSWLQSVSVRYAMGVDKLNLFPLSYLFHYDYGPLESILVVAGLLISLKLYFKKTVILLSVILPFLFVFLYYSAGGFYVRNFVTITPIILIFPAIAINALSEVLLERLGKYISAIIVIFILGCTIYFSAKNSIIDTFYYTKPWGYNVLSNWMKDNFPPDQVVAANPFDPPTGAPRMIKTEFELSGSYSMAEHKDDGAAYMLLNSDWAANPFFFWMSYDFSNLRRYWNKPMYILRNTFYGISVEEILRYQIFSTGKAWQSPDETLVLSKIPVWPNVKMKNIRSFNFDNGVDSWEVKDSDNVTADFKLDPKGGFNNTGALAYIPGDGPYSIVRIMSPLINVKPGFLYKILGSLKTNHSLDNNKRSAFLRLDFWGDSNTNVISLKTAISSRIYKTKDWTAKDIVELAPENAKYLTVSFQLSDLTSDNIWLDNLSVLESEVPVEDILQKSPYNGRDVDLDLFYTNSHGNL